MNFQAPPKDDAGYDHRFHAGNAADVLKHSVMLAVLDELNEPLHYIETHAGAGGYPVKGTGEYTDGALRLSQVAKDDLHVDEKAYLARLEHTAKGLFIPGSPLIARSALDDDDPMTLFEIVEPVARALRARLDGRASVAIRQEDGVKALADGFPVPANAKVRRRQLVLIDPPWVTKAEWNEIPDAVARAVRRDPKGIYLIWYPVKSLTRPNAMRARLEDAGVDGMLVELMHAPQGLKKNRLAGSGMILLGADPRLVGRLSSLIGNLGRHLARQPGVFSTRVLAWQGREVSRSVPSSNNA